MLGITVLHGVNSGMDTFINQAIGAKDLKQVGVILDRGRFIAFLTWFPSMIVLLNVERILILIGQDTKVAHYA